MLSQYETFDSTRKGLVELTFDKKIFKNFATVVPYIFDMLFTKKHVTKLGTEL